MFWLVRFAKLIANCSSLSLDLSLSALRGPAPGFGAGTEGYSGSVRIHVQPHTSWSRQRFICISTANAPS